MLWSIPNFCIFVCTRIVEYCCGGGTAQSVSQLNICMMCVWQNLFLLHARISELMQLSYWALGVLSCETLAPFCPAAWSSVRGSEL